MFSIAPLTSLSTMTTQVDPDPVASFRQLIALSTFWRSRSKIDSPRPRARRWTGTIFMEPYCVLQNFAKK
jgi:hypothetical protein